VTDKKGGLYCLRIHHDNSSWIAPFFTRKERGHARVLCRQMGYYCESVDVH